MSLPESGAAFREDSWEEEVLRPEREPTELAGCVAHPASRCHGLETRGPGQGPCAVRDLRWEPRSTMSLSDIFFTHLKVLGNFEKVRMKYITPYFPVQADQATPKSTMEKINGYDRIREKPI